MSEDLILKDIVVATDTASNDGVISSFTIPDAGGTNTINFSLWGDESTGSYQTLTVAHSMYMAALPSLNFLLDTATGQWAANFPFTVNTTQLLNTLVSMNSVFR